MELIGIIGIFLSIFILIYGSMKSVPLFPLCIIAIVIVSVSNSINVWTAFSDYFLTGAHSAVTSFLLILGAATIYSELMDKSGSTLSISNWCLSTFGRKNVVVVLLVMALVLSLAGMNGMMIAVALYTIICSLLKEANLPRHLAAAIVLFAGNFGDGFYPLSCHINNVLPGQFLGTPLTAGAGFGLMMGVLCLVFAGIYLVIELRLIKKRGEVWTDPEGGLSVYNSESGSSELPPALVAFLPMLILTGMILALSNLGYSSSYTAVVSMLCASLACALLNLRSLRSNNVNFFVLIHKSLERTVTTIAPFIFLLGYGQVVSETYGYRSIVELIIGLDLSPYWKAAFSTAAISGVMASAAGGIRLTLQSLSDYFLNCGANVGYIARIITMSSTALDTLPHCGAIFVLFSIYGLNHKTAYKHCFWMTVVNTSICTVIGILFLTVLGL